MAVEWKDRIVEFPRRYQLVPVSGQTDVFDLVAVTGEVTEVGTPVNAVNMNSIEGRIDSISTKAFNCFMEAFPLLKGKTLSTSTGRSITLDENHAYVTTNNPWLIKYDKETLETVLSPVSIASNPVVVKVDDTHVYVGFSTDRVVRKYLKSDLSYIGETPSFGESISDMVLDDDYIYAISSALTIVKKYSKSTMSLVATSPSSSGNNNCILLHNGVLYVGGGLNSAVKRIPVSLSSWGTTTNGSTGVIYNSVLGSDALYFSAGSTVYAYSKDDGTTLLWSASTSEGSTVNISENQDYVLVGNSVISKELRKLIYVGSGIGSRIVEGDIIYNISSGLETFILTQVIHLTGEYLY